jgi:asparagine synthase (glutamine-hydrolysing)
VLLDERSLARGYFQPDAVRGIIDRHLHGEEDTSNKIWALLQLELWLRTYVDAAEPAPLTLAVA